MNTTIDNDAAMQQILNEQANDKVAEPAPEKKPIKLNHLRLMEIKLECLRLAKDKAAPVDTAIAMYDWCIKPEETLTIVDD